MFRLFELVPKRTDKGLCHAEQIKYKITKRFVKINNLIYSIYIDFFVKITNEKTCGKKIATYSRIEKRNWFWIE